MSESEGTGKAAICPLACSKHLFFFFEFSRGERELPHLNLFIQKGADPMYNSSRRVLLGYRNNAYTHKHLNKTRTRDQEIRQTAVEPALATKHQRVHGGRF